MTNKTIAKDLQQVFKTLQALRGEDKTLVHSYVYRSVCRLCYEDFAMVFHLKEYKDLTGQFRKLHHCPKCTARAIVEGYEKLKRLISSRHIMDDTEREV